MMKVSRLFFNVHREMAGAAAVRLFRLPFEGGAIPSVCP